MTGCIGNTHESETTWPRVTGVNVSLVNNLYIRVCVCVSALGLSCGTRHLSLQCKTLVAP